MKNKILIMKFKIFLFVVLVFVLVFCQSGVLEVIEGEIIEVEVIDGVIEVEVLVVMNMFFEKEKVDGWMFLFDGESIDQWKGYCKEGFLEKGWEVVDGILMCKVFGQGEVGGGGDIIIKEAFGNFELKLEWKIFEGGNSGIFYLACEKCGEDGQVIWKFFFEM